MKNLRRKRQERVKINQELKVCVSQGSRVIIGIRNEVQLKMNGIAHGCYVTPLDS